MRRLAARLDAQPLAQGRRVEPRRVERLQQVVAGRREEAGLGDVRILGFRFGLGQLQVQALELLGALAHAALQRLVLGLELLLRFRLRCRVGVGEEEATVAKPDGSHLEHAAE